MNTNGLHELARSAQISADNAHNIAQIACQAATEAMQANTTSLILIKELETKIEELEKKLSDKT